MATSFDVATYILEKHGPVTHMKLQKLVYYGQAWSLVWDENVLFDERIEAWANGPVVPRLFNQLQGKFRVAASDLKPGSSDNLTPAEKETIDKMLEFYGPRTPQWLSDLTHAEDPWRDARVGLAPGERGDREISLVSMLDYYGRL